MLRKKAKVNCAYVLCTQSAGFANVCRIWYFGDMYGEEGNFKNDKIVSFRFVSSTGWSRSEKQIWQCRWMCYTWRLTIIHRFILGKILILLLRTDILFPYDIITRCIRIHTLHLQLIIIAPNVDLSHVWKMKESQIYNRMFLTVLYGYLSNLLTLPCTLFLFNPLLVMGDQVQH